MFIVSSSPRVVVPVCVNQLVIITIQSRCGNPVHPTSARPVEIPPKIIIVPMRITPPKVPPVTVARKFFILIVRMQYDLIPPTPGTPWKMTRQDNAHNNVGGCARGLAPLVTHSA